MRRAVFAVLAAAGLVLPLRAAGGVDVKVNESARRVDVTIDGKPFTSYIWPTTLKKPVLYPIRTAKGTLVTRDGNSFVFVSDEKTEVFLRDQRRSKAHRALVPDPGAPCDEVVAIDLGAVDPLVSDETGHVRPARDLSGKPVGQVLLGGDSGATLRDMLAAAMLLKSKRVPARLDFLVAPPSRQVLEVLGQAGALVNLIATGARIVEPDRRVVTAEIYPPPPGQLSLRTSDREPLGAEGKRFVIASAETLAYAVATGTIGDPRSFKRPVRVTVPRALPTDDVLIVRERRVESAASKRPVPASPLSQPVWSSGLDLELCEGLRGKPYAFKPAEVRQ